MRLTTERLILRPWEDRDRAALATIQGDPQVRRFYPDVMTPAAVDADIDGWIEASRAGKPCLQAAELKAGRQLVGVIGLREIPDVTRAAIPSHPVVEIGWVLGQDFWGQGLAPEGARAWLAHAWSIGLPEVVAFTARVNGPSQRVMAKIGMARDPANDFDHPKLPEGHPLRAHVVYRIRSPDIR